MNIIFLMLLNLLEEKIETSGNKIPTLYHPKIKAPRDIYIILFLIKNYISRRNFSYMQISKFSYQEIIYHGKNYYQLFTMYCKIYFKFIIFLH